EDNAFVITNFNTICYKEYLHEILEYLSLEGIPRLGSLLAVIAATNKISGHENVVEMQKLVYKIFQGDLSIEVQSGFDYLYEIAKLPSQYLEADFRKLLIQKIFEHSHRAYSIKDSKMICHNLKANIESSHLNNLKLGKFLNTSTGRYYYDLKQLSIKDFRILSLARKKHNSVEELLVTLPKIENEIRIEVQINKVSNILDILEENSITQPSASLAKRLISTLHIPHHHSLPSQQPIGGVSDITNKGNYDQLLISEYANDDITFLSRLANNEALYMRREIPPFNNKLKRCIVIDSSISSWGSVRRISFAIMLAIANHPKSDFVCSGFTADKKYREIEINDPAKIIGSLTQLDISINCAEGLEKYLQYTTLDKNIENIFIGEKFQLLSSKFAKSFQSIRDNFGYIFMIEDDGIFELFKSSKSGLRSLQKMQVSLEALSKNYKNQNLKNENILTADYLPILVSNCSNPRSILPTDDDNVYIANRDFSFIKKYHNPVHWENRFVPIYEKLPCKSNMICIGKNKFNESLLLLFNQDEKQFRLINLSKRNEIVLDIDPNHLPKNNEKFIYYDYHFYTEQGLKISEIGLSFDMISLVNIDFKKIYNEYEAKRKEVIRRYHSAPSVIKKLERVGLSGNFNLIINNHELMINNYGQIYLNQVESNVEILVNAKKINELQFEFNQDVVITLFNSGYIKLMNSRINQTIYFPAIVNERICVATEKFFSGDKSFYKENLFEVSFNQTIMNKIEIVKIVKDLLGMGLKESKEIVDNAPCVISSRLNYEFATKLIEKINKIQPNLASIKQLTNNEQEIMEPQEFFGLYINPLTELLFK
ncbi:MAG: hypothetical protein RLZZ546_333, partial [Bacteroidota bacterium]